MPASPLTKEILRKHNLQTGFRRFIIVTLVAIAINVTDSLAGPYKDYGAVPILLSAAGALLLCLWIFRSGYTLTATILAVLTYNVTFLMISLHIGQHGGTYLYYFPFTLAFTYLLRTENKPSYVWGLFIINLSFLTACIMLAPEKPTDFYLPDINLRYIFNLTFFLSFALTIYFFILVYNFQQELYKRILDLEKENSIQQLRSVLESQEKNNEELMLELRDNINQTLTASRIYLEKSLEEPGNPVFVNRSRELTTEAIQTLTLLCVTLYPAMITDLGLTEGIRAFINDIRSIHPMQIEISFRGDNPDELAGRDKLAVFRIIQEYVGLLLKNGTVNVLMIEVEHQPGSITITFLQDGQRPSFGNPDKDLSLAGIDNRISSYKGRVSYRMEGDYEATVIHLYLPEPES